MLVRGRVGLRLLGVQPFLLHDGQSLRPEIRKAWVLRKKWPVALSGVWLPELQAQGINILGLGCL